MSSSKKGFKSNSESSVPDISLEQAKPVSSFASSLSKWVPLICAGAAIGVSVIALKEIKNIRKDIIEMKKNPEGGSSVDVNVINKINEMDAQLIKISEFLANENRKTASVLEEEQQPPPKKNVITKVINEKQNPPVRSSSPTTTNEPGIHTLGSESPRPQKPQKTTTQKQPKQQTKPAIVKEEPVINNDVEEFVEEIEYVYEEE